MTTTSDFNRTQSSQSGEGGAHQVVDSAKEKAAEVGKEASYQTRQLADDARERARSRADDQAHRLASTLGEISGELRSMASASSAQTNGHLAGVARDGAMLVDDLAGRLQDGGFDAAVADLRRFARQRPWMFLAGAFAVGAGLGRLTRNVDAGHLADAVRSDQSGQSAQGGNGSRGNQGDRNRTLTENRVGASSGMGTSSGTGTSSGITDAPSGGTAASTVSGSTPTPLGSRSDVSQGLPGDGTTQ